MMQSESHSFSEQNSSYRRGLVLGLTMAEVGILIIFILLLLIGIDEWEQEVQKKAMEGHESIKIERLQSLEETEQILKELKTQLKVEEGASTEELRNLLKVFQKIEEKKEAQTTLQEVRAALEQIRSVREQIEKKEGSETLANQVEKQSYRIANQEGQLQRYKERIKEAGLDKVEKPCWIKPDGTIEYLYEIVLTAKGIKMREFVNKDRERERSLLPMPVIDEKETLSKEEFLRRTVPLYTHSLAENCRFFVLIYDDTGSKDKEIYKDLIRTIESHFYKKLSIRKAPF